MHITGQILYILASLLLKSRQRQKLFMPNMIPPELYVYIMSATNPAGLLNYYTCKLLKGDTKWPPFCRRRFHTHFPDRSTHFQFHTISNSNKLQIMENDGLMYFYTYMSLHFLRMYTWSVLTRIILVILSHLLMLLIVHTCIFLHAYPS